MKKLIATIFKYKKALRAVDVVVDGKVIKPKTISIARQIVENCNSGDAERIAQMVQTPAFNDVCDILRITNSMSKEGKTYDNFPEDFLKIARALKVVMKMK